jgi:hypothetical protein
MQFNPFEIDGIVLTTMNLYVKSNGGEIMTYKG